MDNRRRGNPYVGPEAFKPEDAPFFFGRNRDAETLLSLMISNRVGLFYAQSGAGKTSLLNTRLIPDLEKEGFEVLPVVRVGSELPDEVTPENVYVFNTLQYLSGGTVRDTSKLAVKSLADFLRREASDENGNSPPRVLILDQFEEILTTHPERWGDREGFFRQLNQALKADPLLSVLFAMREDHIAGLDPYALLLSDRLRARFRMERLRFREAVKAVRLPAERSGRRFADGVAEALVDDLRQEHLAGREDTIAGEFVEPVQLQVVCYQLWENLRSHPGEEITATDLEASGDVDDALESFYRATVQRVADRTRVPELQIRRFFSKTLITPTAIRAQVIRQPEKTGSLPNVVLDQLLNEHLIRREEVRGGVWYELVHDRFVEPILASNAAFFKRLRRQRFAAVALASIIIAVLAATGWSRHKAREANIAEAVWLSGQALGSLERHPPRSLWLAHQAARTSYDSNGTLVPQAKDALRQALQKSKAKLVANVRSGEVQWLALDFEGSKLATLDTEGKLSLWDVASGQELWILGGEHSPIKTAAFSADSARLATVDEGGAITIWNVAGRRETLRSSLDSESVFLSFSQDGNRLVSVNWDGTVSALDAESGEETFVLSPSEDLFIDAAFQPGGMRLATASANGDIDVWSPGSSTPTLSLSNGPEPLIEFSADGQTLLSVNSAGRFQRWDYGADGPPWSLDQPEAEQPEREDSGTSYAQAIALGPQRRSVIFVSTYGEVRTWDLYSNDFSIILKGDEDVQVVAVFSENGKRFAVSKPEGSAEVWELIQAEVPDVFEGHEAGINSVALSQDGLFLASASDDRTARVWEVHSGLELQVLDGHAKKVNAVAFSPDSTFLATASDDGTARLWKRETGEVFRTLRGHSSLVTAVDFSPNGKLLVTASLDGTAKVWDSVSGEGFLSITESAGGVYSIAFHPNGVWFATGGPEGRVKLWEVETGKEHLAFEDDTDDVIALAFSPDGRSLATASKDQKVAVKDITSSQSLPLEGHTSWVHGVAFSPDGQWLASCDANGKLFLWDLRSGSRALSIRSENALYGLAFSPDGRRLATAGKDTLIRLEPLDDRELMRLAEERVGLEPRPKRHAVGVAPQRAPIQ